jgi:hypothetical protein
VRKALADKPRLERIADAAHRHLWRHHTDRARAERVTVAVLDRRLDGTSADEATFGDSDRPPSRRP